MVCTTEARRFSGRGDSPHGCPPGCRVTQLSVCAREHAGLDKKGGREVNGVVAPETLLLGKVRRLCDELLGDLDHGEALCEVTERGLGFAVGRSRKPATALRSSQRGTRLHNHESG